MADPLSKVSPGDPPRIPAKAYNAFVDAARFVQNQQVSTSGDSIVSPLNGSILIKNLSGQDRARFDVLTIGQPVFGPADNLNEFKGIPALTGLMPAAAMRGRFAILLEPCAAGAVARATVSGVAIVQINVANADSANFQFADIADGVAASLAPVVSGTAQILWLASGTGVQWAVVRLANFQPAPVPVVLVQTGGTQGSSSAAASWTYTVKDLAGNELATAVNPVSAPHQWRRPSVGFMTAATFGYAHADGTNPLVLGWINEVADQEACS